MNFNNIKRSWDFNYFYKDFNESILKEEYEKINLLVDKLVKKYKGKIKHFNEESLLKFLDEENEISDIVNRVGYYLHLKSSLNTQDQTLIKLNGGFENFMTKVSDKTLFISQEFKELGYEKLIEFSNSKKLKNYKNYLFQKANNLKYLLSEKEEFVLNNKENSGSSAFDNLYSELTNSFMFEVEIDGKKKQLTDSETRSLRSDPKREVRKEAGKAFKKIYGDKKVQITLGNTYSAIVKDWTSDVKIRGYDSPMHIRNISEELSENSVSSLLEAVKSNYFIYQNFLKIKAKLLGTEKIETYDLYAPVTNTKKTIKFEEGLNVYLDTIKKFDEEFYSYSINMFENGRVDVFPKEGKRSGAFAAYSKGVESFVLLNYNEKLEDVSTLAHELGHAIHGHLSQVQKDEVFNSPLSLAETASIFNETLLSEELVKTLTEEEKISFLVERLEDVFGTIFRQVQYILFEKEVHEKIIAGEELTYVDFNKIWREKQVEMSGDIINYTSKPEEEYSWSAIPHIFHTPFYCYTYAFGNILSFSLYEQFKKEGKPFIEKYKNILKSGGSKTPFDLLKENGLNIDSKEFYEKGLKIVENMVIELDQLVNKK